MTIQEWTLVFSAVTSGLVLVGGIWLKYVVDQQLKAKDTTIESLNAAIKLHEGQIDSLKGDRAPAIAAEYKTMREHADKMTEEKQALDKQVEKLTEAQKEQAKEHHVGTIMSEIDGLVLASEVMMVPFTTYTEALSAPLGPTDTTHEDLLQTFMMDTVNAMSRLGSEMAVRRKIVKGALAEIHEGPSRVI